MTRQAATVLERPTHPCTASHACNRSRFRTCRSTPARPRINTSKPAARPRVTHYRNRRPATKGHRHGILPLRLAFYAPRTGRTVARRPPQRRLRHSPPRRKQPKRRPDQSRPDRRHRPLPTPRRASAPRPKTARIQDRQKTKQGTTRPRETHLRDRRHQPQIMEGHRQKIPYPPSDGPTCRRNLRKTQRPYLATTAPRQTTEEAEKRPIPRCTTKPSRVFLAHQPTDIHLVAAQSPLRLQPHHKLLQPPNMELRPRTTPNQANQPQRLRPRLRLPAALLPIPPSTSRRPGPSPSSFRIQLADPATSSHHSRCSRPCWQEGGHGRRLSSPATADIRRNSPLSFRGPRVKG